ncbi:MAG: PD-(D/E)XK nuclease family protein [Myxococcales bacterium]|nr:PD-(D/E)XK nuclease family protein [Myxococcales bacterium]
MNLSYFFEGKLAKEEVASAFLAMMLDGHGGFRQYFFERLTAAGSRCASESRSIPFKVIVEHERVDVVLDSDDLAILIENKVQAGSLTPGQLLQYYREAKGRSPAKRTAMVYLAPRTVGASEVARLRESPEFVAHPTDEALHLSWDELTRFEIEPSDPWRVLVEAGLAAVKRTVQEADQGKFQREHRSEIVAALDDALLKLQAHLKDRVRFSRWRAHNLEEILTNKTNVTIWADAVFDADEEGRPTVPASADGRYPVTVRTQFRLSEGGKKNESVKNWWRAFVANSEVDLPDLGTFRRNESRWFVYERSVSVNREELTRLVFEQTLAVARFLDGRL